MNKNWMEIKGKYIRDPRYGHRLGKSYVATKKKKKPGYQQEILEQSTDQYGFVDNGYKRELPDKFGNNDLGIIILGGSAAMGLGATENSKTISAVLEKKLKNKISNKNVYVINAGCGGYSSWDEMIYFLTELILRKPQLVISISGLNDFTMGYFGSKYYNKRIQNTSRSLEDVAEATKLQSYKLSFFDLAKYKFRETKFFKNLTNTTRFLQKEVKLNEQNFTWGLENIKREYDSKNISTFWNNHLSVLGACNAHNIKYHLYIQPSFFWNKSKKLTSKEKEGIEFDRKLFKKHYEDHCEKYFEDLNNEVKYYFNHIDNKKNVLEFLNKIFDDVDEQCYIDHCHLTNKGQEIVSNKIAENILSSNSF